MAERSVKLNVGMSMQGFVSELGKGERAAKSWSAQLQSLSRTNKQAFEEQKQAASEVATGFGAIGGAAALAFGYAVKSYSDFDEKMTQVQSLTHSTDEAMAGLRDQALTAGQAIGVGATEAAEGQIELVKAGVSAADIMGGALPASLNLAAAGQLAVSDATAIASSTMVQFGLKGADAGHIADVLAAGADKALGSVQQLGEGLKYVGPVAAGLGISLDQTVGTLALFASNGILGEQAGTSLRGVLTSLVAPSGAAAKAMQANGIEVYNAQGKFIGLDGAAQVLHDRLFQLDEATRNAALGQIFGNAQITAATILYNEGASGVDKWTDAVNEAGFAQEQAQGKLDTLNGDVQKFGAAWQAAGIVTGEAADGPLRSIVQAGTDLLNVYTNAPGVVQAVTLGVIGLTAAVGLGSAAFLAGVPRVVEYAAALRTLEQSSIPGVSRAAGTLISTSGKVVGGLTSVASFLGGPWGVGIGLGVSAVALLNTELEKLKADSSEVTHILKSATDVKDIYDTLGKGQIWSPGVQSVKDQLSDLDGALQAFASHNSSNGWDAFLTRFTNTDYNQGLNALRDINTEMGELAQTDPSKAVQAFELLADQTDGSAKSLHRLVDAIGGDYRAALVQQADALGIAANDTNLAKLAMGEYADAAAGATDPTQDNADALDALQQAAGQAAPSIDDVAKALQGLTSPTLDAREAQRQLQAAIDDVSASVKENGTSLDVTTEKGRANEAALDAIAQAALDNAAALLQQTGSQDQATAAMETGRESLIKALGQYGITGQAAQDYADKIIGTPKQWATTFGNNAPAAGVPVSEYQRKLDALPASKRTQVDAATAVAQQGIQSVLNTLSALPTQKTITITTNRVNVGDGTAGNGLGVMKRASGGPIIGPGTGTSDDVLMWGSNGEHMWTAREVAAGGGHAAIKALRNAVLAGAVRAPGYATGGAIGARPDLRYAAAAPRVVVQAPETSAAPVIGNLTVPVPAGATVKQTVDEVMFAFRSKRRGGR